MLILSNTASEKMEIGMPTLMYIIDNCPKISCIGNLKTWSEIDYYDAQSNFYYKSTESELGKLKAKSLASNWDLDLDLENLDFIYKK